MTTDTLHAAYNTAARLTGNLPLGQVEYCVTCHSGTKIHTSDGLQVAHDPGCPEAPQPQATMKGSKMTDTTDTLAPSEVAVRDALLGEPKTLGDLVKELSLGTTTVRRALKNLGAVLSDDGTYTLGSGAVKAAKAAAKKATATKKAAPPSPPAPPTPPTATKPASPAKAAAKKAAASTNGAARSREEAQARDAHVLETLKKAKDGMTREQLREASGAGNLTYMSLWRLHKAEKVRKVTGGSRQPVWHAV